MRSVTPHVGEWKLLGFWNVMVIGQQDRVTAK